jgi:hypothetical protein
MTALPPNPHMSITVQYSSTRQEIYRWYLKMWKQSIWKAHLIIFCVPIALTALPMLFHKRPFAADSLVEAAAVGAALVGAMAAYSLLLYKPAPRIVTMDAYGIASSVGKKSGVRTWADIGAVNESAQGGVIISVRSGKAIVLPLRAFHSATARAEFVEAARNWHREAAP